MGAIYGSSYYEIVAGPSWTKAKENAISLGGNLASIQTSEENTYLFTNIVSTQSNHVWIGGSDQELEGSFKWSDNSPWSYANWASGEPNNASVNSVAIKGEDFAAFWLDGSGGWIDARDEYYIEQGRVEMNGIAEIPLSYFSISDASFREGKGGDVTITRTGGTTTSQTLKIVSSDGSATLSNDDYAQVNKTVTFAAGETTKAINISTTADLNLESDESFSLTMTAEGSDDVPPQISDGSATVTIKADDFKRGNSLYTVASGPRWSEAEQEANRLGGHLVTVNSSEENQWLIDTFSSLVSFNGVMGSRSGSAAYTPRAWIGLSDKEKEGAYKWSSGQSLTYFEPSRGYQLTGNNQDYISIQLGENSESSDWNAGMWEDLPNYHSMYEEGIAEIPLGGTPTYSITHSTDIIKENEAESDSHSETN